MRDWRTPAMLRSMRRLLSRDIFREACTRLVKIPMAGQLDSLNLAVATALVLYQMRGAQLKL